MNAVEAQIAALIADLDLPDKVKVRAAVDALVAFPDETLGVHDALHRALRNGQHKNSWALAYTLGCLAHPSAVAIDGLIEGLAHHDPEIRWAIALLLVKLTKSEPGIAGLLRDLAGNGTVNQKRMAIYALRDLQLNDEASLQAMLAGARDQEPTVRIAAVTSLKARADAGAAARRRLLEIFSGDEDIRVRNAAAITLAQWGAPSEDFIAALRAAEQGANAQLKKAAVAALSILKLS